MSARQSQHVLYCILALLSHPTARGCIHRSPPPPPPPPPQCSPFNIRRLSGRIWRSGRPPSTPRSSRWSSRTTSISTCCGSTKSTRTRTAAAARTGCGRPPARGSKRCEAGWRFVLILAISIAHFKTGIQYGGGRQGNLQLPAVVHVGRGKAAPHNWGDLPNQW